MTKFDITKTKKIIFIDSTGEKRIIEIDKIEKEDVQALLSQHNIKINASEIALNIYNLHGHIGQENCSGAEVGIEFRSMICHNNSCDGCDLEKSLRA